MREWSREIGSTLVVIALAVVAVIALWPRDDQVSAGPGTPPPAGARGSVMEDDAALADLRQRAALRSCPVAPEGARASGPLAGVVVPCLADSRPVSLSDAFAGQAVLLNAWASWCVPCREEMPALAEYAGREDAIPVVGINVQDRASAALELMAELGVRYPSVVDENGRLQVALKAPPVLPANYLLLPDGSVQRISDPLTFSTADEVADAVRRHLPVG
ncbi:TlpA family protein disulfide reductase [Saccharopolyspora indica]|uniref:TlpA family protein disulfide reductase n=1 Tax=Saccharopolyspora indica TaxID=1229659 RepID=UPI0022EA2B86|nr:TlpA disulfide reductase family protein [Saccharopolyspora indica]MDA3644091.1 TlpA disulfide reductase family protein [Saccharopolyspora indica]